MTIIARTGATALLAAALAGSPAAAQDQDLLRDHLYTGDRDLVAALDAGDPRAMDFIAGTLGAYLVRSAQGDPMLWWVQRCLAMTYAGPQQIADGIRAYAADRPENADHTIPSFAAAAVLHALAAYCAAELGADEVEVPQ